MGYKEKAIILNNADINKILWRIAHQIIEHARNMSNICLVGVQRRGIQIAERLKRNMEEIENITIPIGVIDITLYRDDLTVVGPSPKIMDTRIDFDINNKEVILIDDVLFTGRSARAAIDEIMDFGRPESIKFVVLVDRGHRELPIRADFVGKNIPTSFSEEISVRVKPLDKKDEVVILEKTEDVG